MSDETNTPLIGKLVQAGIIQDADGEALHGIVIDCGKDVLSIADIPLYASVLILHSRSASSDIIKFMYKGMPLRTVIDVHEGLGKMLDQTS